jgi:hypothetical protein
VSGRFPTKKEENNKQEETTMRKSVLAGLALWVAFAAFGKAQADATETIDAKSAVEFVLSICLPAMDDVASVDSMGQENNWFHLPTIPSNSPRVTQRSSWMANGFRIATWTFNARNLPSCYVGLRPYKKVNRDEFFAAISASLELKLTSDRSQLIVRSGDTFVQQVRQEAYEILGDRPLNLLFSSIGDGTVSSAVIYMGLRNEQDH